MFHPSVFSRLYEFNRNLKLIMILRNPIDRAISHYFHEVRLGIESLTFLIAAGIGILLQMTYLGYRETKYAFWQVIVLNGLRLFFGVALVVTNAWGLLPRWRLGW